MKTALEQAIADIVRTHYDIETAVELTRPEVQFGDYATNIALQLAGRLGRNPREIAEEIAARLREAGKASEATVAGAGFINIRLSDVALLELAKAQPAKPREGTTVVIETNNPNPFKAMHIGHAMNAIVADTIANLLQASGAHTYRVSYHGDVGLHVGKSMWALLRYVDGDASKLDVVPAGERNEFMSRMYAEGSQAYKDDETAKAEIAELAKQSFTREDPLYASVYETVFAWSFMEIDGNMRRLGNQPVERKFLESDADMRGVKIVRDNVPTVFQESNGALVFKGSEHGTFDNAFVSSNGQGLYAARDLGLIQLKNEQYHPDKSYIITAEEQRDYFKGVLAAAGLCFPEFKDVTVNIPTGMVKLSTGKMSSRDGGVITISWLFDQVAEAIRARGGEATEDIMAGALRYAFLKVRVGGDIIFDINESVSIQGNSGPYLQYAHARARSILSKAQDAAAVHSTAASEKRAGEEQADTSGSDISPAEGAKPLLFDGGEAQTLHPDERLLLRKLTEYNAAIEKAIDELLPHYICTYLYELAQEFNRFYEKNRVIGDERQDLRLWLVEAYADTLRSGLTLLGIHAPDRM